MKDPVEPWHGGVPPGVPGAGWLVAAFFVFAIVVFTGWDQGWWDTSHNNVAAAPSHHTTTGAANKTQ